MCERTYHGKANAVRRRSQLPRKCQSFGHRHSIHYIALSSCAVCVLDLYACVQLKMQRKKEPLLRSQLTDVWLSVCCVVLSYHCLRCSFHPMHAVFMWNFFPFSILLLLQLCVLAAPRRGNCKEHRRSQCFFFSRSDKLSFVQIYVNFYVVSDQRYGFRCLSFSMFHSFGCLLADCWSCAITFTATKKFLFVGVK